MAVAAADSLRRPGFERLLLPNTPEHAASASVGYVGERFDASLSYRWSDEFRWTVGPFQGQVPDYGVVDLVGNFDVNEHFSVGLNVANALDDEERRMLEEIRKEQEGER